MKNVRIDPTAQIGENNHFGYGVSIGPGVIIGDNNRFSDNVTVLRSVDIGSDNFFGNNVTLGVHSTDIRNRPELSDAPPNGIIKIGNRTVIREFTCVDLPTGDLTSIGDHCYIAQYCAIPHDTIIEDEAILTNHCSPGGHCVIMTGANLGKGVQMHHRNVVGPYAMLGVGTVVVKNILPAATVAGNPARFLGVNRVGLERNGFQEEDIEQFGAILQSGEVVVEDFPRLTPAVQEVLSRYCGYLEKARDTRTVPSVDIHRLLSA